MTIAGANYREGIAFSPDGAMYVALPSGSTIPSPTFTGVASFANGTAAAPSITFANSATAGLYSRSATIIGLSLGGAELYSFNTSYFGLGSGGAIGFSSTTDPSGTADVRWTRGAAATAQLHSTSSAVGANLRRVGGNAGYVEWGSVSENLTLSTSGTTTDTAANLLPADSYIESVTGRVTTTIATATDWKLGDATTAGRFCAAQSGGQLTAGATVVGLVHCDVTGAGGPRQTSAAKVRVTTTGTPSAGAIRITSYYRTFVAPTS